MQLQQYFSETAAMQTREAQKRPSSISVTGQSHPKKKGGAIEKRERARVRKYINIIIYATSIAKTYKY